MGGAGILKYANKLLLNATKWQCGRRGFVGGYRWRTILKGGSDRGGDREGTERERKGQGREKGGQRWGIAYSPAGQKREEGN